MVRPLRLEFPGAIYHVTARGNDGRQLSWMIGIAPYFWFVSGGVVLRFGWICHAYYPPEDFRLGDDCLLSLNSTWEWIPLH